MSATPARPSFIARTKNSAASVENTFRALRRPAVEGKIVVMEARSSHMPRRIAATGVARSVAIVLALAGAAYVGYGGGFVNYDAMYSLAWGSQLAHGHVPSFELAGAPTPHPLSNLVGLLLAPLGRDAEPVLQGIGYVSIGAMGYAVGLIGTRLFGPVAGGLAALLLLSRDVSIFWGALAYLDVPFTALVLGAIAMEAGRPRRGWPVLAMLALAGLLRPEAWLLAGLYWLWLVPGLRRQEAARLAGLVLVAPMLWLGMDWVVTGEPLFSLTGTRSGARANNRDTGVGSLFTVAPGVLREALRPALGIAAVIGLALVVWTRSHSGFLIGWLTATTISFALPVIAGTPLLSRYMLPTIALLIVLAAAAVTGGPRFEDGRMPRARQVAVALAVLVVVGFLPRNIEHMARFRAEVQGRATSRSAARSVVSMPLPCEPIVVPNARMVPTVSVWRQIPVGDVVNAERTPSTRGSFLSATPAAGRGIVTIHPHEKPPPAAPSGASVQRELRGWRLYDACASS